MHRGYPLSHRYLEAYQISTSIATDAPSTGLTQASTCSFKSDYSKRMCTCICAKIIGGLRCSTLRGRVTGSQHWCMSAASDRATTDDLAWEAYDCDSHTIGNKLQPNVQSSTWSNTAVQRLGFRIRIQSFGPEIKPSRLHRSQLSQSSYNLAIYLHL